MENPIVKVDICTTLATQWAIEDISFEIDHVGLSVAGSNGPGSQPR